MKKINVFLYLFFLLVLINVSISDAMSLKVYAPVVGALFTVNRPRMFSAACGMVGVHRRFPLSIPKKTGWQMVNMPQPDNQKFKDIESTIYRWIDTKMLSSSLDRSCIIKLEEIVLP